MADSGILEKMKIASFTDDRFSKRSKDEAARDFLVQINPASYSHALEIFYHDGETAGSGRTPPDSHRVAAEVMKFELVFDGTGVIPGAAAESDGITGQLDRLRRVLFDYESRSRSPKYLILSWSTLHYACRLSSLNFHYTLFKPDGTPLRARADVAFVAFNKDDNNASRQSSGLSHLVR